MMQPRLRADLALETLDAEGLAERRVQHLERDAAAVAQVLGEIDGRRRPAAHLFLHQIAIGQGVGQPVHDLVGHRAACSASYASRALW